MTVVQNAESDNIWGPRLISRNEILLLQKVYRDNTSYTCLSQQADGSTVICGYYAVKMYGKIKCLPIHSMDSTFLKLVN